MGFENLPTRLRQMQELLAKTHSINTGELLSFTSTLERAALKIEALERDLAPCCPNCGKYLRKATDGIGFDCQACQSWHLLASKEGQSGGL